MKKIQYYFRRITLQQRLLFGFIVLPFLILVVCFILNYNMSMDMIFQKNEESSALQVDMAEENLYLNIMRLQDEGENFQENPQIYYLYADLITRDDFKKEVDQEGFMKEGNLIMLDNAGKVVFSQTNRPAIAYPDVEIIKQADSQSTYVTSQGNGVYFMSHLYDGRRSLGYICYGVPVSELSPSMMTMSNQANSMLVLDKENRYLFGNLNTAKGSVVTNNDGEVLIDEKQYYAQAKPVRSMDWTVMNVVSNEYVMEEVHNSRNLMMLYAIILAFVSFVLASIVYQSIYDPLSKILHSMRQLDRNDIQNNMVKDEGNDELHELSMNFNDLLSWVSDLLNQVEMEQEKKRETQIQLLQAQINPHFLFNTLNTLNYLAIINNDKPVSDGIAALSKLLRNTIVDRNEYMDVEEEIENVKNYIIIQKLRYGDLFETVYNIDEDVKHCRIMKFLLQPIVENSILHAFEEDKEHQQLFIRASHRDQYLEIEIADNGRGFHGEQPRTKRKLSGIGIHNIEERIKLMYGEKFSMKIQSEIGKGTITTLLLPYIVENRKKDQNV